MVELATQLSIISCSQPDAGVLWREETCEVGEKNIVLVYCTVRANVCTTYICRVKSTG